MKTASLILFTLVTLAGCMGGSGSANVDAFVPYNAELDPLVGKWASDGELALIIERVGDQIFIRNPINDTWRFVVSNASASGPTIAFTQMSFLIDGSAHPFNGVPCDATISPVSGDLNSLKYSMTSEHMPAGESDVFTRISNGG